jgi:PAS domain S-box-containing protein
MINPSDCDGAEAAFRYSEEMYRITLANVMDPVFLTDNGGRFIFICPNISRTLGYTMEEVGGMGNISELIRELSFDPGELHEKGEIQNLERVILDKEGSERTFLVSVKRVAIGDATLLYTCHDITERKEARDALRRSEEKYRRLVENLRDEYFFYSHGTDGVFTYLSPSVTSVLGYATDEFMTRYDEFLTDNPINREAVRHTDLSIRGIRQPSYEIEIYHKDGSVRVLEVAECPIPDKNGRTVSVEGIAHDVTERRRAESRERDIARMKNEFISTAAHELNTPLTAIMGYLELLMKQAELGSFSEEQQRDFLSIIYKRSEALSGIIDELLHLSQLESGRQIPLDKSIFEIRELIRDMLDLFADRSTRQITLELPEEPLIIFADREKLFRILENLLSNAIKYSADDSPPILVICNSVEGNCRISVEDKGIGMNEEQLEKVFETFYRVDASNTAASGLGLGTSIAKKFVEAHDGRIWMESTPGEGTKATFTIPMK